MEESHEVDNAKEVPCKILESTIEHDGNVELKDGNSECVQKPTFRNALQAKRRLQAFAQQKQFFNTPNKSKTVNFSEKSYSEQKEYREYSTFGNKPKKENPMDRAKATVEEIELLKMSDFVRSVPISVTPISNEVKQLRRSRSKSSESESMFRKRERKDRNYRRCDNTHRSPSPTITTAHHKNTDKLKNKSPRNWEEFNKEKWTFEKLSKDSHSRSKSNRPPNDVFRQLLFVSPSDFIKPVHYKNERGDDITVPYKFTRYTSVRPKIPYNENIFKVREPCISRSQVLEKTRKEFKTILEKFYTKNGKRCKTSEPLGQRNWYMKNWKESDSKILETSIGLSFLQTYSDDEEEEEQQQILTNPKESNELTKGKSDQNKKMKQINKQNAMIIDRNFYSSDANKDRITSKFINENANVEEDISWTPERKLTEDICIQSLETKKEGKNEIKNDQEGVEGKKEIMASKHTITSEDSWIESPEKKTVDLDKERKKKRKSKYEIESDSISSDNEKSKKKKKKLAKKKRQKEKEKKEKKKEKMKAEKLKEKKRQKEKELLKKFKKEFQHDLEQNISFPAEKHRKIPVKVKIEKEDENEKNAQSVKDLIQYFELEKNANEINCEVKHKSFLKKDVIEGFVGLTVKKEELLEEETIQNDQKQKKEASEQDQKIEDGPSLIKKTQKQGEIVGEVTPDTEEYQSNWESDDGISPIVKPSSKKSGRGWESDEEVFERAFSRKEPTDVPFGQSPVLEMPLDLKFPRRRFSRQERKRSKTKSPEYLDMDKEIKLLEAGRINLNKERMQLEIEKMRLHDLERKKTMKDMEQRVSKDSSLQWHTVEWHKKEDNINSVLEENWQQNNSKICDKAVEETAVTVNKSVSSAVVSVHSSPEITSTKSPNHKGLESVYQEFMKAVSAGGESKDIVISSTDSDASHPLTCVENKKDKVVYSRSQRDRKRKIENVYEDSKPLITTDPKILQEILLPGEIPIQEQVTPMKAPVMQTSDIATPVPVPVPSPRTERAQILTSGRAKALVQVAPVKAPISQSANDIREQSNKQQSSEIPLTNKPFSFSTLVIPSKRQLLLERSGWKLDDDSDEDQQKIRKIEEKFEPEQNVLEEPLVESNTLKNEVVENVEVPKNGQNSEEKQPRVTEECKNGEWVEKRDNRSYKKSRSPLDTSRDKRRNRVEEKRRDSSSRREELRHRGEEHETKRRDRGRRPVSPRRREISPRKRRHSSPIHRRSSPRHRSPPRRSEGRRSERGDRRCSPSTAKPRRSYSPAKSIKVPRRRSPSPRDSINRSQSSKSPRRSPMEGLKRSVADSTISDDLLPQPFALESSNSPLCSSTPAPCSRRQRLTLSPKRPSLDERINQVLGIESEPQQAWKPDKEPRDPQLNVTSDNMYYHHQQQFSSVVLQQQSKVLQVGNNLQVVPTEDLCAPPPPQPVAPPAQKILQVGNMLQIVPSDMVPIMPSVLPPRFSKERTPSPDKMDVSERLSAEDVLDNRMAENSRKRKIKEDRKKDKEKKKKEKAKRRKMRLKVSTEDMIKRALELDGYIGTENEDLSLMVPEIINETPGLDISRSILSRSSSRFLECTPKTEKERKSVQFADGVRPGEGTSPSGGEELASPPPQTEVLLKPKKYKKLGSSRRKKKKQKAKLSKKKKTVLPPAPPSGSDEEYENLPPPSPPPGSPPPSVFPPRAKVHTLNNIPQHYLTSYGISTAPQTPPMVQNQSRINLPYQTPPTAMYRTPPPHVNVANQLFPRMSHASNLVMNVPPPTAPIHREQQPYGSF